MIFRNCYEFETVLKYHEWHLCQISLQIMLFFVYSTTLKCLVIFTRRSFKLSWNTTVLSQSSCRNFSCSSIKPVIHCIPFCSWMKEASCNWTDTISSTISLCSEFKLENIYRGVNFCGKKMFAVIFFPGTYFCWSPWKNRKNRKN